MAMPRQPSVAATRKCEHPQIQIDTTFEAHYRISDLARLWGLGRETVRKLVKDDPGVIKIRMGRKKAHTIYSIPESAAHRIHTRLLNADQVHHSEPLPGLVSAYRQTHL
jgi:hypothetical protein